MDASLRPWLERWLGDSRLHTVAIAAVDDDRGPLALDTITIEPKSDVDAISKRFDEAIANHSKVTGPGTYVLIAFSANREILGQSYLRHGDDRAIVRSRSSALAPSAADRWMQPSPYQDVASIEGVVRTLTDHVHSSHQVILTQATASHQGLLEENDRLRRRVAELERRHDEVITLREDFLDRRHDRELNTKLAEDRIAVRGKAIDALKEVALLMAAQKRSSAAATPSQGRAASGARPGMIRRLVASLRDDQKIALMKVLDDQQRTAFTAFAARLASPPADDEATAGGALLDSLSLEQQLAIDGILNDEQRALLAAIKQGRDVITTSSAPATPQAAPPTASAFRRFVSGLEKDEHAALNRLLDDAARAEVDAMLREAPHRFDALLGWQFVLCISPHMKAWEPTLSPSRQELLWQVAIEGAGFVDAIVAIVRAQDPTDAGPEPTS
jgi:hypothetical protein